MLSTAGQSCRRMRFFTTCWWFAIYGAWDTAVRIAAKFQITGKNRCLYQFEIEHICHHSDWMCGLLHLKVRVISIFNFYRNCCIKSEVTNVATNNSWKKPGGEACSSMGRCTTAEARQMGSSSHLLEDLNFWVEEVDLLTHMFMEKV